MSIVNIALKIIQCYNLFESEVRYFMKIINKYSYGTAKIIQESANQSHQRRYELYYSFKQIYGDVFKFIILIIASIILKSFIPTILITISFATLRHYAGGLHMKTSNQCLVVTVGLFIINGAIISRLNLNTAATTTFIFISCIISYVSVLKYAPRDCKSKPIETKEEFNRLKINSLKCLSSFTLIEIILIVLKFNHAVVAISTSCLLVVLTIIPSTYKIFR